MTARRLVLGVLSVLLTLASLAWQPKASLSSEPGHRASGDLESAFRRPPDHAKPWAYWWWLNGNVTRALITHDLEAMKRVGIGGLLHFDARGYHEDLVPPPESRMEFMSPQWREMLKFSLAEAGRLGLEVSVNLSSCAGALKGPWEVGDDAPKKLVWSASAVRGPQRYSCELNKPEGKRFWRIAVVAVRHEGSPWTPADGWHDVAPKLAAGPVAADFVDLSDKVDTQGRLTWDAPAGQWTVLRFGCVTMAGHEYDVDILDPKAVEGHFERMGKTILRDAGPLAGKTLTHFYSVSWEGAAPTWTRSLEELFAKYRGYKLRPWLPVLAGVALQSREESERFLRDYYKTLGDAFRDNFYGTMQELCHRAGLKWHSESGGPWDRKLLAFAEADQLAFLARNDMPQGEFWFTGAPIKRRQDMNRPQAMTAHIYGKPLAATEAFTHMVRHWSAYPAALKPFADAAFCDGVNHFVWHTFTASPPELGKPGSEYFAGTHINPNVTWFPQAGPFMDYLGRCQFMLRQGLFVGDVCVYIGGKPYQHWGRGTNWNAKSTLKLGPGYAYDLVNTEVLLDRFSVNDGQLLLPDGMRYRLLVVDLEDDVVPPAALDKIVKLAKAGATVVLGQRQPQRAPGLAKYPIGNEEVRRLAAQLWADAKSQPSGRALELGKVFVGTPLDEVLQAQRIAPDCEGQCEYTHRRMGETDIYFVSGTGAVECTFRVSGKEPELWDPTTGRIRAAVAWRATNDGRTTVPLLLPENGSTFVVFRKPAEKRHLACLPAAGSEIVGRNAAGVQIRDWQEQPLVLAGPWTVLFEGGRGAPASAVFEELVAWNEHPDSGIKYFSGKATYRKSFELSADRTKNPVRLQLGEVRYIAQVKINGKDLGVVWTDPWAIELTGAVKPGKNELEIAVVNTWVNRLIGDAGLPNEKRITKTNVRLQAGRRTLKIYQGFASEDPLMPSGLLGPVRLDFGRIRTTEVTQ